VASTDLARVSVNDASVRSRDMVILAVAGAREGPRSAFESTLCQLPFI